MNHVRALVMDPRFFLVSLIIFYLLIFGVNIFPLFFTTAVLFSTKVKFLSKCLEAIDKEDEKHGKKDR